MKAIALTRYLPIENPESLIDIELDRPSPAGHDVLVAIKAIAVNPVDVKVRAPKDAVEKSPRVLGWDAAGVVHAVGPDVSRFKVGDRVFYAGDITRPGSNSEFQLVDERIVGNMPQSLSFEQAAALPLTAITAWEALFDRLKVPVGSGTPAKSILIIGGAGGVGSIAIQLAVKVAGLSVIATASRPESEKWVRELGAQHVINHFGDLPAQLKERGFDHVDYVLILNDTDRHFPAAAAAVAPQGMICTIVENAAPLDVSLLKAKSAGFVWEFMFTRSMFQTADMQEQGNLLDKVAGLIDDKTIVSTLSQVLSPINAANLRQAHATLETGRVIGKIVLKDF
ncbi:Bifunctional protein: zinc-containing alcohol dehydrogenase; quinone oxidoreductase (NADPH:quinone reductase) [Collimonas arenae]|uniref:Zinc-type alcohol dehydrogenase-like protein n=1 Tax=Collimonas arenae TaxID=279058 RepID=A0A0A1FA34_9BURK|nr:zinc-binding alcohol dehydrogenase family protein [Collimonas arenae]AIY41376.1 Bifunctional protein: zinc-containing alcohol dehydrogenase; quinone oxidoreductase (NADPH:quinone reductase) [Collimonas arenae]